jgi:hypothetical protein
MFALQLAGHLPGVSCKQHHTVVGGNCKERAVRVPIQSAQQRRTVRVRCAMRERDL